MGLNIVKEGSWLYFVKGEVGGEHTFPTCLELLCSNSLHSDYATFEITCGVSWYFIYIGITLRRLKTSETMFVERTALFVWVTSSDKSLSNRILFCWGGNTQKQAKCRRAAEPNVVLESCPGSIPVVYLTVSDILMAP